MFSEELGGNVSRKRAEEAKERRKRLLQQKARSTATAVLVPTVSAITNGPSGFVSSTAAPLIDTTIISTTTPATSSLVTPVKSSSPAALSWNSTTGSTTKTATKTIAPITPPHLSSSSSSKMSAVETAALQREWRALQAGQHAAAIRLQSRWRGRQCRIRQIQNQCTSIHDKLRDIRTLQTILLRQKPLLPTPPLPVNQPPTSHTNDTGSRTSTTTGSISMIPSTTTSTMLLRQFLFVDDALDTRNRRLPRELQTCASQLPDLLQQLLTCLVLPGLLESSSSSPGSHTSCVVSSWIQCPEKDSHEATMDCRSNQMVGRRRLRRFLHCLVRHSTLRITTVSQSIVLVQCLRALLLAPPSNGDGGGDVTMSHLTRTCRSYLLSPLVVDDDDDDDMTSSDRRMSSSASSTLLDLVSTLRRYLVGLRDKPIPTDADEKREASFSGSDQNRAGALFTLVLDAIDDDNAVADMDLRQLQAQFVKDILTIPLLTWRISAVAIARLVEPPSTSSRRHRTPRLMSLLHVFTEVHCILLNNGQLEMLLENSDLPMSVCGATGSQRLLANCLSLARLIPACNGSSHHHNRTPLQSYPDEWAAAAKFFHFVTSLLHAVPLGTFTSRESAIAWIPVGDGNLKAIVLSPTILEQCQVLLVDSYVRRLLTLALDAAGLLQPQTISAILASKTDSDLLHEQQLAETGNSSAASLAAKEARVNRNKSFWESSKWARKLTKGVTQLLQTNSDSPSAAAKVSREDTRLTTVGVLFDTSSQSRQLAEGNKPSEVTGTAGKNRYCSSDLLMALVRMYSTLLARWGGGGNDDIIAGPSSKQHARTSTSRVDSKAATSTAEPWVKSLLNVLCFSTPVVRVSWSLLQSDCTMKAHLDDLVNSDRRRTCLKSQCIQSRYNTPSHLSSSNQRDVEQSVTVALFYLFLCTFSHLLIITDDVEIHDMDRPFPLHQIRRCIGVLKKLLYRATCTDTGLVVTPTTDTKPNTDTSGQPTYFGLALIAASSRTMRDLYDRSSRRPICVPNLWIVPSLMENEISRCKTFNDYQSLLSASPVFRVCPYMVSFKRRLKLFERIITVNRVEIQGENSSNPFHTNPLKPGIPVRIQRDRLLEDGIATMNNLGTNMRQRIAVQYYNEAGARETGIDAGGLFKEFWTDLCAIAFDPNYALFRTTDSNCLYPNPSSISAHGSDHTTLFAFLGRILGKALYEGITIHPKFAHFFLSFLKGDYNFLHMLPDLSTVDSQLYNNLMFLKTYDGEAADLALSFTVTVDEFGGTKEVPLMRNGTNIDVTNGNKQLYVGLVAKYYVYDRIREQSEAMTRGLFEVVDRSWLRLFNEPELQVLISGSSDGKLDIDDMKAHCQYAGGYSSLDRTVSKFWKVVASFDEKQQGSLLRFVTSCERAPPLGFGSLNPPFTIHRVGILRDGDRLPTASTCFNVLKLPTYSSEKILRDRLLYAIESGAGFELS